MSTSHSAVALYTVKLVLFSAVLGFLNAHCISGEKEPLKLSGTNTSVAKGRWARSVSSPPQPIDCVLSSWSSWSQCDPCRKKRYRFARLEKPSQFNGDPCDHSDKETEDCVTNTPCRNKVRCEGFVCAVTGRCITRRLLCNGDDDCGDQSDEKNCKKVFRKCDQKMEQYWAIENLAKGIQTWMQIDPARMHGLYIVKTCKVREDRSTNVKHLHLQVMVTIHGYYYHPLKPKENFPGILKTLLLKDRPKLDLWAVVEPWSIGQIELINQHKEMRIKDESRSMKLNIFTNELEGSVLDHRYYAGGCSPHYIEDTRFRKPYNVERYTPETKGKYEFTLTEYDSYSNYESNVLKAKASQSSFSFGINLLFFELGYSSNDRRFKKFFQRMKRFSSTSSKFIHARCELDVAIYKLKPRALMLHYEFMQRLQQLPSEYSYGEYRELYRDYGTHYITEATVGGIYEYTLVLNRNELQKTGYSLSDVQRCTQHGFNIGATIKGVYVGLGATDGTCKSILREIGDSTYKKQYVEDFIALVRGGASEHITTLAHKDLPTAALMQEWGDAVQYNPEIIKLKAQPLYQLVTPSDFANAVAIKANLQRALEELALESSSCRCAPCRGNGIPVLKGSECKCLCPLGYSGTACEITKREDAAVSGSWGCWTSWSACSGGQRSRRRQCNNPAPLNGGSSCAGPDAETLNC